MSPRPARYRYLERRVTADAKVPLSDDDREMEHSWRYIAIRPTNDEGWFILNGSRKRSTVWGRWHEAEGRS